MATSGSATTAIMLCPLYLGRRLLKVRLVLVRLLLLLLLLALATIAVAALVTSAAAPPAAEVFGRDRERDVNDRVINRWKGRREARRCSAKRSYTVKPTTQD